VATATGTGFSVLTLDGSTGEEDEGRIRVEVRRELGIRAFGTNAYRSVEGGKLIGEHDEAGFRIGNSDQEELYVVVEGKATFDVDGEKIEAPAGTAVLVRPESKRSAVAEETGTTVLAIGGTPGEAYVVLPEQFREAFEAYNNKEYEKSIEIYQGILASGFPNEAGIIYNIACNEALLGRTDNAIEHLKSAIQADGRVVELARTDTDMDPIREDTRFKELVG
jgi:mannose-6-phosphate isomerase-like protein (cupin superfamily)